ncbi:hypothetical protein AC579_5374 [Pseudocercospora musae]|uniref:Uncharacterized protein n=1 Tax=Pseudocercospora musae TaxID=113226 RepID=A0A139H3W7_9PEZI|nr:hypothetical protein AC579_5374 [Pseudocercospora musae]
MAGAYVAGCQPDGESRYWTIRELAEAISEDSNYQWHPADLDTTAAIMHISCRRCTKSLASGTLHGRAANRACDKCRRLKKGGCEESE